MSQYTDNQGYVRIYDPADSCSDSKGYIYEHRKKMAEKLREEEPGHPALDTNGCLRKDWMVHHEDENKSNNDDGNLHLKKDDGHKRHHFTVSNPHPEERDELGRFI